MTQSRRDDNSTEFGLWIRGQLDEQNTDVSCIDSSAGYTTTNIDFVWNKYTEDKSWMLIEEKRYGWLPKYYQLDIYKTLDKVIRFAQKIKDFGYRGFHVLVFEKTCPEDGRIWLDGKTIDTDELLGFMTFTQPQEWYQSYFPNSTPNRIVTKITFS